MSSLDWQKWSEEGTKKYAEFSVSIPSDLPAYEVVYALLAPNGKKILDFGCYDGNMLRELSRRGMHSGLGVDNNAQAIADAEKKSAEYSEISFVHVDAQTDIPSDTLFDAASMTFVHPTIQSEEELSRQIEKVAERLTPGAPLVMLSLHENSFNGKEFMFYGHTLPTEGVYKDGLPFPNELRLPNGETVRFYDYCWTNQKLTELLYDFDVTFVTLTDTLTGAPGNALKTKRAELENEFSLVWKNEWTAPLYQITYAIKK
jgi:SAM-dependent methyltransferase